MGKDPFADALEIAKIRVPEEWMRRWAKAGAKLRRRRAVELGAFREEVEIALLIVGLDRRPTGEVEKAFLRDILDDPDDATARLIYADWLEERGDPGAVMVRAPRVRGGDLTPGRWYVLRSLDPMDTEPANLYFRAVVRVVWVNSIYCSVVDCGVPNLGVVDRGVPNLGPSRQFGMWDFWTLSHCVRIPANPGDPLTQYLASTGALSRAEMEAGGVPPAPE
jgi:uncharacterized protein (TIGR02996 family)